MKALNTVAPGADGEYVFGKIPEPVEAAEVGQPMDADADPCSWESSSSLIWHRPPHLPSPDEMSPADADWEGDCVKWSQNLHDLSTWYRRREAGGKAKYSGITNIA